MNAHLRSGSDAMVMTGERLLRGPGRAGDSGHASHGSHAAQAWLVCIAVPAALGMILFGCERYRIEYRDRPAFFSDGQSGDVPDRVTLDDGTVIVYRDRTNKSTLQRRSEDKQRPFLIREEFENGDIVLRAIMPEHVLANTLTCLRNREYQLLWDQLLAEETRAAYEQQQMDVEDFAAFFDKYRQDLAATVNRMSYGLPRNEVVIDDLGSGRSRLRFHPLIGSQFRFRSVSIQSESGGLKLVKIE